MKRIFFLVFMLVMAYSVSAQVEENNTNETESSQEESSSDYFIMHKVLPGEKIIMISRKYLVDPKEIYRYNKEAVNGVTAGTMLMIPLHESKKKDLPAFIKQLEKENKGSIRVTAPAEVN